MNQSIFTVGKPVLLRQLKDLALPFNRLKSTKATITLELTITDKLLTLVVPGARFEMYCETRGTCKATVPLFYFLDIVKTLSGTKIACAVSDQTININGTKISALTTFFDDDSILRSIKLPLNYTDWHLLRLQAQGYTDEELLFNKLYPQISSARQNLTSEIDNAARRLKVYGVTRTEIEELIMRKLML